jgi:pimeloyl-ACP methyl ester carboxylesterase
LLINGLLYSPAGAGPHPTLVICHGLPGNEKNLDLAQVVRRAGWNAVTFNYRGSWGSPGSFRFAQNLQDADAVLAYLRDPSNVAKLGIDPKRIAIAGHSMGGWVVAHTAAHDHALSGAILISMADMGLTGGRPRAQAVAAMADDMETLADVTAESMVDELTAHAKEFVVTGTASGLAQIPVLAITANDHLAPQTDALVAAIKAAGGTHVTAAHLDTDHAYSDRRIALESIVITWLSGLN